MQGPFVSPRQNVQVKFK